MVRTFAIKIYTVYGNIEGIENLLYAVSLVMKNIPVFGIFIFLDR